MLCGAEDFVFTQLFPPPQTLLIAGPGIHLHSLQIHELALDQLIWVVIESQQQAKQGQQKTQEKPGRCQASLHHMDAVLKSR